MFFTLCVTRSLSWPGDAKWSFWKNIAKNHFVWKAKMRHQRVRKRLRPAGFDALVKSWGHSRIIVGERGWSLIDVLPSRNSSKSTSPRPSIQRHIPTGVSPNSCSIASAEIATAKVQLAICVTPNDTLAPRILLPKWNATVSLPLFRHSIAVKFAHISSRPQARRYFSECERKLSQSSRLRSTCARIGVSSAFWQSRYVSYSSRSPFVVPLSPPKS